MPTVSNSNGSGPADAHVHQRRGASWDPESVEKGGPFDLGELERLANEMFTALPGAFLPGLDPGQLKPVALPPEAESLRPPPEALPSPDGHLVGAEPALERLSPGLEATALNGVTGLVPEASNLAAAEDWSYLPDLAQPEPHGPAALPPSTGGGAFALSGDPMPLSDLGLAGLPRGMVEDPFAGSYYFLQESPRTAMTIAGETVDAEVAPHSATIPSPHPGFDSHALRREFPALAERVHGRPLVWLDNGATTQKPEAVIERLDYFYRHENSNIHRAAHEMAARATDAYEDAREKVARFLHASSSDEVVFVRGTTEAINLVAQAWGRANVGPGDEILITWLEHHANIVPWQQLCQATGARLRVAPVDDSGQVMLDEYERLLSDRTRIVAFSHVSNALGTITPVKEMTELAHRHGARVLIDGAQAVSHMPVDVQLLDSDYYAFSGHKLFGPTGIGVLHGKLDLLNSMPPWQGGGNMIRDVTFERSLYQPAPVRFEAGTTSIADAVGLGAALDYLQRIGMHNIARHEHELLAYATAALADIPGLALIGTAPEKAAVLSFVLDGFTPEEVGEALDREGIAVRAGHHCAQPTVRRFGHEGTVRASMALYNTREDIDALIAALRQIATRTIELPRGTDHRFNTATP
jgi:cysteine desulfurase / selenocysteine lyase